MSDLINDLLAKVETQAAEIWHLEDQVQMLQERIQAGLDVPPFNDSPKGSKWVHIDLLHEALAAVDKADVRAPTITEFLEEEHGGKI